MDVVFGVVVLLCVLQVLPAQDTDYQQTPALGIIQGAKCYDAYGKAQVGFLNLF